MDGVRHCDEPGVFIAFEETAEDLTRNMQTSINEGKLAVAHGSRDFSRMSRSPSTLAS